MKANKGAAGIDGMSIEEILPYLKEHQQELKNRILRGKYTPSPVRRVEIPKPDGGVRKLGIPTAISQNTHVYMETVETSENKENKSDKDGSTRILCEHGGKLPKRTLVL